MIGFQYLTVNGDLLTVLIRVFFSSLWFQKFGNSFQNFDNIKRQIYTRKKKSSKNWQFLSGKKITAVDMKLSTRESWEISGKYF
jgi:hypothetical protein